MVKGMITIATQQEAVARAESVRVSSAATRGSGRGATATRAAATALVSAWAFFPHPMIQKRISVPWAVINDGGRIPAVSEPSYRLLVVDDEPLALNLAKRVFETESDIALHAATSAVRALETAMIHDIDLVITDQRMPEMTGLQFLARVREVRPRALRVLLTAFPDTSVALKAINEGLLYRFILKPWEPEDMRVTVRRALEPKRLSVEPEPCDLDAAVAAGVQLRPPRLRESVRLGRNLQGVPLVRCRGPEITQGVLNLLGNGVDAVHRSPEPTIHVRTWHEGATVRLEIADNGAGLDPAIAQRLFKPFTSTQPISRGRDLGLSVCKSIVENHGGSIEAAADGTRGARFTV